MHTGYFDGASKGNPGQAGIGCVIVSPEGRTIWEHSEAIGIATNNEAEYTALIRLLENARALGIVEIHIKGDSQLVINQVSGGWKINHDHLFVLCEEARTLLGKFKQHKLSWIPREKNKQADRLSNIAFQTTPTKKFTGELEQVADYIYIAHGTEPYAIDLLHEACTCPAFVKGKTRPCKHLLAAATINFRDTTPSKR